MQTEILRITGLNDAACADHIARTLDAIDGVDDFNISLAGSSITVRYDERRTSSKQFQTALLEAGYGIGGAQNAHANGSCCGSCGG
ncbi:MAG TPA: heavy-metal-associated domain-containing protein [Burkholderiaceae bacterium]|nr:heavy-metal-associated domain-containing protein [Burkholderiaceae bacterium]